MYRKLYLAYTLLFFFTCELHAARLWERRKEDGLRLMTEHYESVSAAPLVTSVWATPEDDNSISSIQINHAVPARAELKLAALSSNYSSLTIDFTPCDDIMAWTSEQNIQVDLFMYEDLELQDYVPFFDLRTAFVQPVAAEHLIDTRDRQYRETDTVYAARDFAWPTCCGQDSVCSDPRETDARVRPRSTQQRFATWSSRSRVRYLKSSDFHWSVGIDVSSIEKAFLHSAIVAIRLTTLCDDARVAPSCMASAVRATPDSSTIPVDSLKFVPTLTPGVRLQAHLDGMDPVLIDFTGAYFSSAGASWDISIFITAASRIRTLEVYELWIFPHVGCLTDAVFALGGGLAPAEAACAPNGPYFSLRSVASVPESDEPVKRTLLFELNWRDFVDVEWNNAVLVLLADDRVVKEFSWQATLWSQDAWDSTPAVVPGTQFSGSLLQRISDVGNDIDALIARVYVPPSFIVEVERFDVFVTSSDQRIKSIVIDSNIRVFEEYYNWEASDALLVGEPVKMVSALDGSSLSFAAVRSTRAFAYNEWLTETKDGLEYGEDYLSEFAYHYFMLETPLDLDVLVAGLQSYRVFVVAWPQGRVVRIKGVDLVTNNLSYAVQTLLFVFVILIGVLVLAVVVRECCDRVGVDNRPRCPGDLLVALFCTPICVVMPFVWMYRLVIWSAKICCWKCREGGGDARDHIVMPTQVIIDGERERLRALPYMQPLRAYERWCLRRTRQLASIETAEKRSKLSVWLWRPLSFFFLLLSQLFLSIIRAFFNILFFITALGSLSDVTVSDLLFALPIGFAWLEPIFTSLKAIVQSTSPGVACPFIVMTIVIASLFASLATSYVLIERNWLLQVFLTLDSWKQAAPVGLRKQFVSVCALLLRTILLYAMQLFFVSTQSFYSANFRASTGVVDEQCRLIEKDITDDAVERGFVSPFNLGRAILSSDIVLRVFLLCFLAIMFTIQGMRMAGKARLHRFALETNKLKAADEVGACRRLGLVYRNFFYFALAGVGEIAFMVLRLLLLTLGIWPRWLIRSLELESRATAQLRVGVVLGGRDEQNTLRKREVWATDYEWQNEVARSGEVEKVELPKPMLDTVISTVGQAHCVIWLLLPFLSLLAKLGEALNRETPFISSEYARRVEMPTAYRGAVYVGNLVQFGLTLWCALRPSQVSMSMLLLSVLALFALDLVRQCGCRFLPASAAHLPHTVRRQTVTANRRRTRHETGRIAMRTRSRKSSSRMSSRDVPAAHASASRASRESTGSRRSRVSFVDASSFPLSVPLQIQSAFDQHWQRPRANANVVAAAPHYAPCPAPRNARISNIMNAPPTTYSPAIIGPAPPSTAFASMFPAAPADSYDSVPPKGPQVAAFI